MLSAEGCICRVRQPLSGNDVPGGGGAAGLAVTAYESVAEGRLELVDGKFQLTAIMLTPTITLKDSRVTDVRLGVGARMLGAEHQRREDLRAQRSIRAVVWSENHITKEDA